MYNNVQYYFFSNVVNIKIVKTTIHNIYRDASSQMHLCQSVRGLSWM